MKTICRSIGFLVLGVVVLGGRARAAEGPLLVAVEIAPGVDVAPADVRQAVASELGTTVVGSREPSAAMASDVLVVGLDSRELRMSLRAGAAPPVSRTISTPPDRSGRLRSMGWLAGNLVRDQVSPLVATHDAGPPAAAARPATEPPALADPPTARAGEPDAVVAATRARIEPAAHSTWAITAGGALTVQPQYRNSFDWVANGNVYSIEVHRRATPESYLLGVAVEAGPNGDQTTPHFLGAAPIIGSGWRGHRWFIEGSLGVGIEALIGRIKTVSVTNNSSTGTVSETKQSFEPMAGLYGRLQGTAGLAVSRSFDLVAQVGAHVSSEGQYGSYLSSGVGLRLRLP